MSILHYPDPNEWSGRSYCGDLVGNRVPQPPLMNGWRVPFINYHLTTCPACLAKGPRLYLTEGNGMAVGPEGYGYLIWVKSRTTGGSSQIGTPVGVPGGIQVVQVAGPS